MEIQLKNFPSCSTKKTKNQNKKRKISLARNLFFIYLCTQMAKKPDIGNKAFSKLLAPLPQHPNKTLIKRLDAKMFAFDQNKVYNYKPELLAFIEFKRCLELFNKRNPDADILDAQKRMPGTQMIIVKEELPHREKLQQLAIDTIKDIYQVPDYLDLKGMITPRFNLDTDQDVNKETFTSLSLSQKNEMRDEINKRVILNGLVHGSAMHIWKGIYHLVSAELKAINPSLIELYDTYTSTTGILIWGLNPDEFKQGMEDDDVDVMVQGYNKLQFNRQEGFGGSITAKAINFPVLLHELNKGVMDWLISAGIPKEYNEDQLRYYYAKADSYENELYHYVLSPTLWSELLLSAQLESHLIPKLISRITRMTYPELTAFFRLILDDKEEATRRIKLWNIE